MRDSDQPASRDQAAADTGISRSLAAYHLDTLAQARLLTASMYAHSDAETSAQVARQRSTDAPRKSWP